MTRQPSLPLAPALVADAKLALVQQLPLLLLTAALLDGGDLAKWTAAAVVGHWLGVAAVARKRPDYRRPTDRWYVRWASVPLIVTAWLIEPAVHRVIRW